MLTLVDLFSGCGGLSLGMELVGFHPVLAVEQSESAMASYLANRPEMRGRTEQDVREVAALTSRELRKRIGLQPKETISLVAGGPPCQGFSGIGHRRTNGDVERDEIVSNHLYQDMVAIIDKLNPEAFLFENVRGILSAKWRRGGTEKVWDSVRRHFLEVLGGRYVIAYQTVRGYDYGVPQNRPRVLMIGLRQEHWHSRWRVLPARQINEGTLAGSELGVKVGLLPPSLSNRLPSPHPIELLGDLVDDCTAFTNSARPCSSRYLMPARNPLQAAMRAKYQKDIDALKEGAALREQEYSRHSPAVRERFKAIQEQAQRLA